VTQTRKRNTAIFRFSSAGFSLWPLVITGASLAAPNSAG
jgi:hypothetical protein